VFIFLACFTAVCSAGRKLKRIVQHEEEMFVFYGNFTKQFLFAGRTTNPICTSVFILSYWNWKPRDYNDVSVRHEEIYWLI
jgi:hypothetical protein